jgi:hypothetical protein
VRFMFCSQATTEDTGLWCARSKKIMLFISQQ